MAVTLQPKNIKSTVDLFRQLGFWSSTKQDLLDKAGISKGHHVLLYGDLSEKLVSRVLQKVGSNGKVYAIGRSRRITELIHFLKPNYRNRVVVNPECTSLPAHDVHVVLLVNSHIKPELLYFLSNRVRRVMHQESQMVFIEDAESQESRIQQIEKTGWLRLGCRNSELLIFERIL